MKTKTIKAIIRKKVDEWLASIEDEGVRELAKKNTIVTGGCIASMLLKEKVNDFDLYFRDYATAFAVANYYVSRFEVKNHKGIPCKIFLSDENGQALTAPASEPGRLKIVIKSAGIASEEGSENKQYRYFEGAPPEAAGEYVGEIMQDPGDIEDAYEEEQEAALEREDKPKYRAVFMSSNAITLSHRVQIINRFYGEPNQIHENYDFIHCTNYWTSWNSELVLRQPALEALLARELRYVGSRYPICSLMRTRKFIRRGWSINAGQILKMALQVSKLDLTDFKTLEDQLTGVDVAYFSQLLGAIQAKNAEAVDTAYIVEIVDRMF